MAATSGDGNPQQQPSYSGGDNFAQEQLPPIVGVWGREQLCLSARPAEKTRLAHCSRRRPAPGVWHVSIRALRLCRRLAATGRIRMLRWFAAQPLGQQALQSAGNAVVAVKRATLWARATTDKVAEDAVTFRWYLMIPVVMVLMIIRTGAVLAEKVLGLQLPQITELEQSDAGSDTSSIPPLEPVTSSSSGYSTPTGVEENGALSFVELTPPPESAGDKTVYFSPGGGMQTNEETEEEQQPDVKPEEVEGEKAEEKTEEPPTITAEEAIRAAMAVVQPLPPVPPVPLVSEEAEKAAMGVVVPPPPPATSEELLAAEKASGSQPAVATATTTTTTTTTTTSTAQEDLSKDTKKSFVKMFGKMFARNIPERVQLAAIDEEEKLVTEKPTE